MTDACCFAMLGPPASGKGTQGRLLAEKLGIAYLSTGARLRREVEKGTELGLQAKAYLDANRYVPDELATLLVGSWLQDHPKGWLLDGFPRSVPQAQALLEFPVHPQHTASHPFTLLHLSVPVAELRKRVTTRRECLACGASTTSDQENCPKCGSSELEARADDSTEGLEKRLHAYEALTVPALEFLQTQTKVVAIDGTGSREEIANRITQKLS